MYLSYSYVKNKNIRAFIRYRQLKSSIKNSSPSKKMIIILRNLDIIAFCVYWKILGFVGGRRYESE